VAGTPRTYGDRCGVARALDVVGERWALLVVRELLFGPKRFTDLRTGLPRVSPEVLAQRLRELEEAGVMRRRTLPPPAASKVYELTARGAELEPVLLALGRWGANTPTPPPEIPMSLDSHLVSLKTLFDATAARDFAATIALGLGDERVAVVIADGRIDIARGEPSAPDATIETDPPTLLALIRGRRPLPDALAAGAIRIDGDRAAAERFLRLFPLPRSDENGDRRRSYAA
jgi:DNA-binding HxlR family transcriptional regulator/putative sterol carrier protein